MNGLMLTLVLSLYYYMKISALTLKEQPTNDQILSFLAFNPFQTVNSVSKSLKVFMTKPKFLTEAH